MLCQVVEYTSYRWSNLCEGVIVHCCIKLSYFSTPAFLRKFKKQFANRMTQYLQPIENINEPIILFRNFAHSKPTQLF